MSDPFDMALGAIFGSAHGLDATYTPAGGSAFDVRAKWIEPDVDFAVGGQAKVVDRKRVLEVRKAELATAASGDTVEVPKGSGDQYRVMKATSRDSDRRVWTLELAPQ